MSSAATDRYRLPRTVVPSRYELTLEPDLTTCTYTGHVRIAVSVAGAVREIVLNSVDLDIADVALEGPGGERLSATVSYDSETERASLALDGEAAAGEWTLDIRFSGNITESLSGFYRSTFTDGDGNERIIATTQFEATDARRAFPCWDEPDFKASFAITLVVADGLAAFSNGPAVQEEPTGDGRRRITFGETMKMSTYLVAFVIGPLEYTDPVDVDGTPLRVAFVPGKRHLADFALDVGASALRFFASWFGIPYPAEKLDMIALPDFAFGAMENLGCVTYRETALLVAEGSSQADLERVADVVCHEIAHMWFGDLVTMKWWNGIWLNEAFATFMELLAVDDYRPDWERWGTFGRDRASALVTDGLAATRPIEFDVVAPSDAEGMFDVLTYQKGGGVLRMLEQYLGAERFREGIRLYLNRHAYGNAETSDLWDAIEEATGEPVRSTMDSWIFQGGHPLVSVERSADGTALELTQRRFRFLPDPGDADVRWSVPVLVRAGGGDGDGVNHARQLLDGPTGRIELGGKADWAVVNAGGSGFYRVRYSAELLRALTGDLSRLDAIERFNLVSDTWAAVLAGLSPVTDFLELFRLLGDEADPNVWDLLTATPLYLTYGRLSAFDLLDRAVGSDQRPQLQEFLRGVIRPAFDRLGWAPSPGEDERTSQLRATLLRALGTLGNDQEVRDEAARLLEGYLADRSSLDPEIATAAISVVAWSGGGERWEEYRTRKEDAPTPQEQQRFLLSLGSFPQRDLVQKTLEMALSEEVRSQNTAFFLNALLANRSAGEVAWQFVKDSWDAILERIPSNGHARMLLGVTALVGPELVDDVEAFLAEHPVAAGGRTVEQAVEQLKVHVAFRRREGANVSAALER